MLAILYGDESIYSCLQLYNAFCFVNRLAFDFDRFKTLYCFFVGLIEIEKKNRNVFRQFKVFVTIS